MRLPYGRAVRAYRGRSWRWPCYMRLGHARLLWAGPWLLVAYTGRISWADLDAKIERAWQRKQNGRQR